MSILNRILFTVAALAIVGSAVPAQAHCGVCGTGHAKEDTAAHDHGDIVDTAVAAGGFETLVAAVKAAGLVETLKGEGPFTVFAPTDEAFAALPKGTVENLLKPENKEKLIAVLTYHVVPAKVKSDVAVTLTEGATVNGQKLKLEVKGDKLMINDATVVKADIMASNGVIHVIDKVLLPSAAASK